MKNILIVLLIFSGCGVDKLNEQIKQNDKAIETLWDSIYDFKCTNEAIRVLKCTKKNKCFKFVLDAYVGKCVEYMKSKQKDNK